MVLVRKSKLLGDGADWGIVPLQFVLGRFDLAVQVVLVRGQSKLGAKDSPESGNGQSDFPCQ
jgi:hypothetical protein